MLKSVFTAMFGMAMMFVSVGCDVDKTRDGRLPDVDVDVSGDPGQMPAFDVDAPDVDVTTEEKTITVPDVDINSEEKTIDVPNVDITLPKDE